MHHSHSGIDLRAAVWSADADIQAMNALARAATNALAILSPALAPDAGLPLDEELHRCARLDEQALQRVLDMVDELGLRLRSSLNNTRLELRVEDAIVAAADALTEPAVPRRACG